MEKRSESDCDKVTKNEHKSDHNTDYKIQSREMELITTEVVGDLDNLQKAICLEGIAKLVISKPNKVTNCEVES